MTYREDFTLPAELMERVSKQGFEILCFVSEHVRQKRGKN